LPEAGPENESCSKRFAGAQPEEWAIQGNPHTVCSRRAGSIQASICWFGYYLGPWAREMARCRGAGRRPNVLGAAIRKLGNGGGVLSFPKGPGGRKKSRPPVDRQWAHWFSTRVEGVQRKWCRAMGGTVVGMGPTSPAFEAASAKSGVCEGGDDLDHPDEVRRVTRSGYRNWAGPQLHGKWPVS